MSCMGEHIHLGQSTDIPRLTNAILSLLPLSLSVEVGTPVENVLSLVQTHAHEAAECLARFENQRNALWLLLREARNSLGCASLEVDWSSGVSAEQVPC